jgi:diguanylate cyclase (GGDEF)-like protein
VPLPRTDPGGLAPAAIRHERATHEGLMNLDVQTLLIVMMINMIALSIAIPTIMGWRVSVAARFAQGALISQTLGWACLVMSSLWMDRLLSTASMTGLAVGMALLWQSMRGWLGMRPGGRLVWALALLIPLGYGIGFDSYPFRVGWSNFGLALQMATVSLALLWRAPHANPRWRVIMACSLAALAVATAWRGVLGAFFTEVYPSFRTPHPVNLAAALLSNLTVVLNSVGLLVAWREEVEGALRTLARTDSLTGLLNRRALQDEASALIAQARRHGDPLTVLLIDLDRFKQINDSRGHDSGDRALCLVATLLQEALRRGDLASRWGGEEFCVVLARGGADAGAAFDQRLRSALAERSMSALGFPLAFSTGMTTLLASDDTLHAVMHRADNALYAAKAAGRGRLVVAGVAENRRRAPPAPAAADPRPTEPAALI